MSLKSRWKFVIQRISITNALRFWQTSPLAVAEAEGSQTNRVLNGRFYVIMRQNARKYKSIYSAFSFADKKSARLKRCAPILWEIFRILGAEDAARLTPCKDDKLKRQKFSKNRAYGARLSSALQLRDSVCQICTILRPPQRSCRKMRQLLSCFLRNCFLNFFAYHSTGLGLIVIREVAFVKQNATPASHLILSVSTVSF